MITASSIAEMIDHSLLKPELTTSDVVEGCELAREYCTASVCVRPCDVSLAREILKNSKVMVTTVVGFPHGSNLTEIRVLESLRAIDDGAVELDMVINIGRLLSRDFDYVLDDIRAVVQVAHKRGVLVKVILENCFLERDLIIEACRIAEKAGTDFVKTSTGFAKGGATTDDLRLMRESVGRSVQIKAAGGVRTLDAALMVIGAGATRFGATASKEIIEEARKRESEGTLRLP